MKLILFKLGARPAGRLIEQHDLCFCAAESLADCIPLINAHWPDVHNRWHVDAWRLVTCVEGYAITLRSAATGEPDGNIKNEAQHLYLLNLGGYWPGAFEEFHQQLLMVGPSLAAVTARARRCDFFRQYDGQLNALQLLAGNIGHPASHIDEKYAVDLDEVHRVTDILRGAPAGMTLQINPLEPQQLAATTPDRIHLGYLPIKQLRQLTQPL